MGGNPWRSDSYALNPYIPTKTHTYPYISKTTQYIPMYTVKFPNIPLYTGSPGINGDKSCCTISHYNLCSISFQDRLCVPLKNIGQYGRFEYNLFSELFLEAEICRPQVKLGHQAMARLFRGTCMSCCQIIVKFYLKFCSGRWGPRFQVCARRTLRSAPHRREWKFFGIRICIHL